MEPLQTWLVTLLEQDNPFAPFMRTAWGWPIMESLHFISLSLLIGAIGMFDLRLLGVGRRIPIAAARRLVPWGLGAFAVSALIATLSTSVRVPVEMSAPSRSCSIAISSAEREVVPSLSSSIISDWVPARAAPSAASPASNAIATATFGTAVRRASVTGMPFDSVACSTAGKASAPTGATGGYSRFAPGASSGAGARASGAGGGTVASSPQPPICAPSSVRSPGTTAKV